MQVILDTNVLVAALMVSDGPPHQLFEAFLNDRFTLITSDAQIEEFSRVTRYPAIRARIHPAQAGRLLSFYALNERHHASRWTASAPSSD
jgi:uncharacterized protein